jgi:hypothetical protein
LAAQPAPELTPPDPAFEWIWRAWWRLHPDRPMHSMGMAGSAPGRIPWRDVRAWCAHHGYGDDAMAMLEVGLAAMDKVYLEIEALRRKK